MCDDTKKSFFYCKVFLEVVVVNEIDFSYYMHATWLLDTSACDRSKEVSTFFALVFLL